MIATDTDERRWRFICVRVLLCVSILYYLATLLLLALGREGLHPSRALSQILVLLLLSVGATLGLSRYRVPSIVAIAIAALVSLWIMSTEVFDSRLLSGMTHGIGTWQTGFVVLVALAFNLLPAVAFLVVWPLRPPPDGPAPSEE